MKHRRSAAALALCGLLTVAACGDDDDGGADAVSPAATSPAASSAATTEHDAGVETYCQTHVATEAAVSSEDPAAIESAFADLEAAAVPDNEDTVATVVAEALAFLASEGPPSPEFDAAYGELIGWVGDHCGFAEVSAVATEYAFGGISPELAAGPTIVTLTNEGAELHELALLRKNDGVTESIEELLALPEEEAMTKLTSAGSAFAMPGATGHSVVDLTAGDYVAVCFLPTGATPEAMAEMETSGGPADSPPHFVHGMVQAVVVTDDGTN